MALPGPSFLGGHGRAPDLLLISSVPRGLPRAAGKERAREGPGCRVQGALGLCRMDVFLAFPKSCPVMSWMEVLAEGARGGIRDWCDLLETSWCHPLAASPSSSPCWRWIPCHKQLDAEVTQPWDCHPATWSAGCVPPGAVAPGGSEVWLQEEVPGAGQSSDGPSAHGWAASGARRAPGHELCLPALVLRSTLACCSRAAPRCCCREVQSSSGALGGLSCGCPRCPARGCVLGTEQAVCGDGQQCGDTRVVWFAEVCCLVPAGRGLVGTEGGCNCGRLKQASVGCWKEPSSTWKGGRALIPDTHS